MYYNTLSSRDPELGEHMKTNWKRFLDDCFMIWFKSELDLKSFHNFLNDLHPDMKFTIESSEKQLPFLDVLVKKQGTIFEPDLFSKQTGTKYLNFH